MDMIWCMGISFEDHSSFGICSVQRCMQDLKLRCELYMYVLRNSKKDHAILAIVSDSEMVYLLRVYINNSSAILPLWFGIYKLFGRALAGFGPFILV